MTFGPQTALEIDGRYTDLAAEVQEAGRQLLASEKLLVVSPSRYSTDTSGIANVGQRVINAACTQAPLVEVVTLDPADERNALMVKLFGSGNPLIHSILVADGLDLHNERIGAYTIARFTSIMRPGTEKLGIEDGLIEAAFAETEYSGYDPTRPGRRHAIGDQQLRIGSTGTYKYERGGFLTPGTAHEPARSMFAQAHGLVLG